MGQDIDGRGWPGSVPQRGGREHQAGQEGPLPRTLRARDQNQRPGPAGARRTARAQAWLRVPGNVAVHLWRRKRRGQQQATGRCHCHGPGVDSAAEQRPVWRVWWVYDQTHKKPYLSLRLSNLVLYQSQSVVPSPIMSLNSNIQLYMKLRSLRSQIMLHWLFVQNLRIWWKFQRFALSTASYPTSTAWTICDIWGSTSTGRHVVSSRGSSFVLSVSILRSRVWLCASLEACTYWLR